MPMAPGPPCGRPVLREVRSSYSSARCPALLSGSRLTVVGKIGYRARDRQQFSQTNRGKDIVTSHRPPILSSLTRSREPAGVTLCQSVRNDRVLVQDPRTEPVVSTQVQPPAGEGTMGRDANRRPGETGGGHDGDRVAGLH